MTENVPSETQQPEFKSQLCHSLAVGLWKSYFLLASIFFILKMGMFMNKHTYLIRLREWYDLMQTEDFITTLATWEVIICYYDKVGPFGIDTFSINNVNIKHV